jgi:hypothetical protein
VTAQGTSDKMYIYKLIDPRDGLPRYVGQTGNPSRRFRQHVKNTQAAPEKYAWINELKSIGMTPAMIVIQEVKRCCADCVEAYWIYRFTQRGYPLVNHVCRGGPVYAGGLMTDEVRKQRQAFERKLKRLGLIKPRALQASLGI